jgi:PII-like signaling protein
MREKKALHIVNEILEDEEFNEIYTDFLRSGGLKGLTFKKAYAGFYARGIERGTRLESSSEADCSKSDEYTTYGGFFK